MQTTIDHSAAIRELVDAHKIMLVGAIHTIRTGEVEFFDKNGKKID